LADKSLLSVRPDLDGVLRIEADDKDTLHSLGVVAPEALLFDRHRMCVPLHWPVALLRLLHGEESSPLLLFVTRAPTTKVAPEDVLAHMQHVHLLQTPEYRPVLTALLRGEEHIVTSKGRWDSSRTWKDVFAAHPRLTTETLPLTVTHRGNGLLLAKADPDVVFCLDDPFFLSSLSDVASPSREGGSPKVLAHTAHKGGRKRAL
jgi:hypothetical protein